MSKVNSVKALRAKRAKRLAQKRGIPPIKGSSYHRPWRTTQETSIEPSLYCSKIYFEQKIVQVFDKNRFEFQLKKTLYFKQILII